VERSPVDLFLRHLCRRLYRSSAGRDLLRDAGRSMGAEEGACDHPHPDGRLDAEYRFDPQLRDDRFDGDDFIVDRPIGARVFDGRRVCRSDDLHRRIDAGQKAGNDVQRVGSGDPGGIYCRRLLCHSADADPGIRYHDPMGMANSLFGGGSPGADRILPAGSLEETPAFEAMEEERNQDQYLSFKEILAYYWRTLLIGMIVVFFYNVVNYTVLSYMPSHLSAVFGYGETKGLLLIVVVMGIMVPIVLLMGYIGDRIGSKRVVQGGLIGLVLLSIPAFLLIGN